MAAHQIGSGTLLVRDEDGNFSFIHQSVLEFLVARVAAEDIKASGATAILGVRELSLLMADFFAVLAGRDLAAEWARRVLREGAGDRAMKNALVVLGRLGMEANSRIDLAGKDLRGQDFSGRDLRHADLRGADLSEARLVRTNLSGALMARARLVRADLSGAILEEADLTGPTCRSPASWAPAFPVRGCRRPPACVLPS